MLANINIALDSQFVERFQAGTRQGEEGLMLAILQDAIESFQVYLLAKDKRGKQLFRETEEWILEKNSDWIFSFENICQTLRLDPNYVRRGLLCCKEAKLNGRPAAKVRSVTGRRVKHPTLTSSSLSL